MKNDIQIKNFESKSALVGKNDPKKLNKNKNKRRERKIKKRRLFKV